MSESSMARAMVIHVQDNVATLMTAVEAGGTVRLEGPGAEAGGEVRARGAIPFGHKVALRALEPGESVLKYGQVIGVARGPIAAGEHVHTHNLRSLRGGKQL